MGCFQTQVISHLELKIHVFLINFHIGTLQGRPQPSEGENVLDFTRPTNFKNHRTHSEGQDEGGWQAKQTGLQQKSICVTMQYFCNCLSMWPRSRLKLLNSLV